MTIDNIEMKKKIWFWLKMVGITIYIIIGCFLYSEKEIEEGNLSL